MRWLIYLGWIFVLLVTGAIAPPAWAQSVATDSPTTVLEKSISDLGSIDSSGEIVQLGRSWSAGQTPDRFLTLEDTSRSLAAEKFSLAQISEVVGNDLTQTPLSEFPLATTASIQQLADSVPQLSNFPVSDIEPIAELAVREGIDLAQDKSLGNAIAPYPQLATAQLSELGQALESFSIQSIPNLDQAQLDELPGWEKTRLSEVPGLKDVPLNSFPNPLEALGNAILRIDMIYSTAETTRHNPISGSYQQGFNVKCAQPNKKCAYIELDDLENEGRSARGGLEGKQWISGKYQSVEGGEGCLKIVSGGKEPTGRHPFGELFKVVVMEPDETSDEVNTALFFQFSTFCGKTPYFLGPVPFLSYKVNDNVFVGALSGDGSAGESYSEPWDLPDPGGGIQAQLETALKAAGVSPCGSGLVASGNASNVEGVPLASGDAVERAIAAVPSDYRHTSVNSTVKQVIGAAQAEGINDPAHIAYMLATVQFETSMGRLTTESQATRSLSTANFGDGGNSQYYGRGLAQLTGKANYRKASNHFGVDFVGNPQLAADPKYSARILAWGMKTGKFSGVAMGDYLNSRTGQLNWRGARQVVNDADKSARIAAAARRYYQALGGANTDLESLNVASNSGTTATDSNEGDAANSQGTSDIQEAIASEYAPNLPNLNCTPNQGFGVMGPEGSGIATGKLVNPAPGYALNSGFGRRQSPCAGCSRYHPAVDLNTPTGTPIKAADGGVVIGATYWDGYGYTVVVDHGNGLKTRYSHLSSLNVQTGQKVSQGQVVAQSGSSGKGTGPHLDFGVYKYSGSNWRTPKSAAIDPQSVINF